MTSPEPVSDRDSDAQQAQHNPTGVLVRFGRHKATLPVGMILSCALAGGGAAWHVVKADRDEIRASIATLEKAQAATDAKLAVEQVTLANIQASLARIDARVAEVQVTLMRGRP